jgi:hypothetical protein
MIKKATKHTINLITRAWNGEESLWVGLGLVRKRISICIVAIAAFFYAEVANADQCFSLSAPIEFGNKTTGKIEINSICQSDIQRLMSLPIYGVINDVGEGAEIDGKRYKTCSDRYPNK